MDRTQAIGGRDIAHICRFNTPVHSSAFCPNFKRLAGHELVAQAMLGCFFDVGHRLNEMHEDLLKNECIKPGFGQASERYSR